MATSDGTGKGATTKEQAKGSKRWLLCWKVRRRNSKTIPGGEEKLRLWGKERRVVRARTVELPSWSGSGGGEKTLRHETRIALSAHGPH
jgi:hypothetical protein